MRAVTFLEQTARYVLLVALAIALAYAGRSFSCIHVDDSFTLMRPEIKPGAMLLVDRHSTDLSKYDVGDVVCFECVTSEKAMTWAGRIAAKPGDTFRTESGALVVNGHRCKTGSAPALEKFKIPELMVPSGHVLVSFRHPPDSRLELGRFLVPVSAILGRVR